MRAFEFDALRLHTPEPEPPHPEDPPEPPAPPIGDPPGEASPPRAAMYRLQISRNCYLTNLPQASRLTC